MLLLLLTIARRNDMIVLLSGSDASGVCFNMPHLSCINLILNNVINQQKHICVYDVILVTKFSPTCFDRPFRPSQGDAVTQKLKNTKTQNTNVANRVASTLQ